MANLEIVKPPKFSGQKEWDCSRCHAEELKHPVFLSDGGTYGTGCAAILLGMPERRVIKERDIRRAAAASENKVNEERRNRYQSALQEYERDPSHANDFHNLRLQHAKGTPELAHPKRFADYLKTRICELS